MIQGGDPAGDGTGGSGKTIEGEFSHNGFSQNTLLHTRGVISMARSRENNSASSQFFIMHADGPHLDGAYAAFGKVVSGMDVVDEIAATPVLDGNGSVAAGAKPIMKKVSLLPTKGVFKGKVFKDTQSDPMKDIGKQVSAIKNDADAQKIIMNINDMPITKSEYEVFKLWSSMNGMWDDEILESFVLNKLLKQKAIEEGCVVSDEEATEVLSTNIEFALMDPQGSKSFNSYLEGAGITKEQYIKETVEDYRESLLVNKLAQKLKEDYIKANETLSPEALEQGFYFYSMEYAQKLQVNAKVVMLD